MFCSPVRGRLKDTAQTVILHRPQLPVGYLDNPQTKPLMSGVYLDKPQCSKVQYMHFCNSKSFKSHQNLHLLQNCHTRTVTCFQTGHLKQSYHEG